METPREIEDNIARLWLETGAIRVSDYGSGNTYYVNEFDHEYFCKNYPAYETRLEFRCMQQEKEIAELNRRLNLYREVN